MTNKTTFMEDVLALAPLAGSVTGMGVGALQHNWLLILYAWSYGVTNCTLATYQLYTFKNKQEEKQ